MKHQVAALPFRHSERRAGSIEVLLVTSSNGRWIVPKGDVDEGMKPHLAAEKEAFEEGGVRGRIGQRSIACFRACKQQDGANIPIEVGVFPLEVDEELDRWPEMNSRRRRWEVEEPELAAILRSFRP